MILEVTRQKNKDQIITRPAHLIQGMPLPLPFRASIQETSVSFYLPVFKTLGALLSWSK